MTNNQLAENSVNQLLNNIRLARDNAERADNRVDHSFYYALTIALEELQERRKADSEPVMYQARMWNPEYEEWDPWAECNENAFVVFSQEADRGEGMEVRKLYAAPQPAPVVPAVPDKELSDDVLDGIIAGAKTSMEQYLALSLKAEREAWRQGEPTDDERIMAIEGINNCERCGDEGWIVGEMGITRCACSQDGTLTSEDTKQFEPVTTTNKLGNSPVIPDGYVMVPREPTAEMISSGIAAHYERSQIQIHDRPAPGPMECAYVAMLAAAPQETHNG